MNPVTQALASLASLPVGAVAHTVHGWMTGKTALLTVEIKRLPDAMSRAKFNRGLRAAAADPNVAGVVMQMESAPGSWAACHDLRESIRLLRAAGTVVYATLEQPSNALVWIASAADRVFLVPTGELLLVGLGAELTFFGRALDAIGVAPDFEAAGAYKSFGEPYTRSFASKANQEAIGTLIDDLHDQLVRGIAEGRNIEVSAVEDLLANAPIAPVDALELGLIDQVAYADEIEEWIEEHHGKSSHLVEFEGWARRAAALDAVDHWGSSKGVIHVLHLDGPIVMDSQNSAGANIRAKRVVKMLKDLREDDDVKAVVLHVNSPGGSALASDLMWREVDLLAKEKPVVACYEDVSASGGVYLAAPATEIVARPTTLTGSIGVFGGKLVMGQGMRKVGVTTQQVLSAPNAGVFSSSRPFTDNQRVRFRSSLQRFYDGFVQRVADGRKVEPEVIEPHCRGRVWTGRLAKERGLIDQHGDLYTAMDRARDLAGMRPGAYRRRDRSVQPNQNMLQQMVQRAVRDALPGARTSSSMATLFENTLGKLLSPSVEVLLAHPGQMLALLPFDLEIR